MITLPRVASRVFGEPLAIEPGKLSVIVSAIGPRLQGFQDDSEDVDPDDAAMPYRVMDGIAVIGIYGTLVCKSSGMSALSGMTSYADIAANFSKAMSDPSISGIVLSIDSPGGEVNGMLDCADLMYGARGTKPVVAFVNCAASAAYALGSTADKMVVSRTGLTGSVGIIALHLDESAADEKAGLKYTAIYAGDRKNDGNPHAPLSPEAKDGMQSRIDTVYGMFTESVARNRGMKDSAVRATQAAVYMGQAGVDAGFADSVGTIDDAANMLRATISKGDKSLYAISGASAPNSTEEEVPIMETPNPADAKTPTPAEIEALLAQARTEGYADAAHVAELCVLAGKPDYIAAFISEKKSAADVRKILIDAKVKEQPELDPGVMPGADAAAANKQPGKARPWKEVIGALAGRK